MRSCRRSWQTTMPASPSRRLTSGTSIVRSLAMTISRTPLPGRRIARSPKYDQVLFILEPNEITRSLACKRVMVLDYPDGRFAIRHNGVDLPYRTFREQAPWSGACLHRREAEGAGHVAVGQGTAATWPAQSHVQGRIALQPRNQERRLPSPQNSDICNWRKK